MIKDVKPLPVAFNFRDMYISVDKNLKLDAVKNNHVCPDLPVKIHIVRLQQVIVIREGNKIVSFGFIGVGDFLRRHFTVRACGVRM